MPAQPPRPGSAASARPSGIPRLSRLPVPASSGPSDRHSPNVEASPHLSVPRVRPRAPGQALRSSTLNARPPLSSSASVIGTTAPSAAAPSTVFRPGIKPDVSRPVPSAKADAVTRPKPPASNLGQTRRSGTTTAATATSATTSTYTRPSSTSPPPGAVPTARPPAATVRGPRPSLSDRTVETLFLLPSSPAGAAARGRRTSSFFIPIDSSGDATPRPGSRTGGRRVSAVSSPRPRAPASPLPGGANASRPATPSTRFPTLRNRPSHPRLENQPQSRFSSSVGPMATGPGSTAVRPRLPGTKTMHPRLAPAGSLSTSSRPVLTDLFSPPSAEEQARRTPKSPAGMVMMVGLGGIGLSSTHPSASAQSPAEARTPTRSRSPVRMSPTLKSPKTPKDKVGTTGKNGGSPVVVMADFPVFKTPPTVVRKEVPSKSSYSREPPPKLHNHLSRPRAGKAGSTVGSSGTADGAPAQPGYAGRRVATAAKAASTAAEPVSKSSSALRDQIRRAKAAHKAEPGCHPTLKAAQSGRAEGIDYDSITDPFNQLAVNPHGELHQRIRSGRETGRLNVAGLGLGSLPDEVTDMFNPDAPGNKNVEWGAAVDLVRLDAADNDLIALPDRMFPDIAAPRIRPNFWDDVPETGDDTASGLWSGSEESFLPFHRLQTINLMGNHLNNLPVGIRRLEHLTSLNLSRNSLDHNCIAIIADLPALRDLRLSGNTLDGPLPDAICRIASLETLELRDNRLTEIPPSITTLSKLRVLDVSGNRLSSLPMESLAELPSLHELMASRNRLSGSLFGSDFSPSDRSFRALAMLDLSVNSLNAIFPPAGENFGLPLPFPALTNLTLSSNCLSSLPSLASCPNLVTLLVSSNSLSSLPDQFTHLTSLRTVSLANNRLRDLAPVDKDYTRFSGMKSLVSLDLSGNPLRDRRLIGMSVDKIRERMVAMAELAAEMGENADAGDASTTPTKNPGTFGLALSGLTGW